MLICYPVQLWLLQARYSDCYYPFFNIKRPEDDPMANMTDTAHLVDIAIGLSGLALIVMVFLDVFQSIIVPHYTPKGTRLSPRFISKVLWQPLRTVVKALPESSTLQGNL